MDPRVHRGPSPPDNPKESAWLAAALLETYNIIKAASLVTDTTKARCCMCVVWALTLGLVASDRPAGRPGKQMADTIILQPTSKPVWVELDMHVWDGRKKGNKIVHALIAQGTCMDGTAGKKKLRLCMHLYCTGSIHGGLF
jgi:hypothetical protein